MVRIKGKKVSLRKGFKRTLVTTLLGGFFLGIGYGIIKEPNPSYEGTHEVRVTEVGQTLWDIAKEQCPDKDTREVIYDICQLNQDIEPDTIHLEDRIKVPIY